MDNIAKELNLLFSMFEDNLILQMEIISSLIIVSIVLGLVYFGLKIKKVRECFDCHIYNNEPTNFKERLKLYLSAPLMSGNGICMWRVYLSIPLAIITVIVYDNQIYSSIVLQIYVFLFVTDALDGAVARSLNNVTNIGKVLDPFADKFLDLVVLSIVVYFSENTFFMISTIIIIIFDIIGQSIRGKTKNPAANWVGKTKTVFKIITIYLISLNRYDLNLEYIGSIFITISLIFTLASFYLKAKEKIKAKFESLRRLVVKDLV